jgi:hypothetical protein
MNEQLDPNRLRDALLKMEVMQFARSELHVVKDDLREYLRADAEALRQEAAASRKKIVGCLVAFLTLLVGSNVWGVTSAIQRLRHEVEVTLAAEVTKTREQAAGVLANESARIREQVRIRLDAEFAAPRIRQLVEEKAQEYTKREAQSYILAQVGTSLKPLQERVASAMDEAAKQRSLINTYSAGVTRAIDDLAQQREMSALGDEALAGSREAYDRLSAISRSQSTQAEKARARIGTIRRSLAIYLKPDIGGALQLNFKRKKGTTETTVMQDNLSIAELFDTLNSEIEISEDRRRIMGYIAARPKQDIIDPALAVLGGSTYLPAIAATCGVLQHVFGPQADFLDIGGWIAFLRTQQQGQKRAK